MPYAVVLHFSDELEKKVLALWQKLADTKLTSSLLDFGISRPHISLASFEKADVNILLKYVENLAKSTPSFSLNFDSVGSFPTDEKVVYLAPNRSDGFISIHREFHKSIQNTDLSCNEYYLPGKWLPHCTVAYRVEDLNFKKAIEYCQETGHQFHGNVTGVGVLEYWPIKELASFPLKTVNGSA
ncbi:MAG: 2'-5' RNA ligase family protein [Phycisphaerae bacterium]|nr:2'-5' RNA ligase family protein [Phycisphaerae bacterium]